MRIKSLFGLLIVFLLSACGGGGGGGSSNGGGSSILTTYLVGGSVAGLNSGNALTLSLNGSTTAALSSNGSFTFGAPLTSGSTYSVTVSIQPTGQICTVSGGSGVITSNITNVAVNCVIATYKIGGTIANLGSGTSVVLQNNGTDNLTVSANGSFTFATPINYNAAYAVTVATQPTGQTCTVSNGTGTTTADVTNITVSCVVNSYKISGTITNVASNQPVTLTDNGGDSLVVSASGTFTFATSVSYGGNYSVAVSKQPLGQTCTVTNGSGTVSGTVTSISVDCTVQPYFALMPSKFNIVYPTDTNSAFVLAPIDINGDGKMDLVVHYFGNKYSGQSVGNITAPNAIRIYIQQDDGSFQDQTSTYLIGSDDLGGWSRKFRIVDINGDGKPDIIFAMNEEDGRNQSNSNDMNAQQSALISVGSKYKIVRFGTPSWHESVGVGFDQSNRLFAIGNGHSLPDTTSDYFDSQGNVIPTNLSLPSISSNAFEFMNNDGSKTWTNYLIQQNDDYWNQTQLLGYIQGSDGKWIQLPTLTSLATSGGVATYVGYTGNSSQVPVWLIDGYYISGAFVESCQTRVSPNSNPISVFAIGGTAIPNYQPGVTVDTTTTIFPNFHVLKGAQITNGQLVEVPLNIQNQQEINVNSNFFECKDVNNDGYADLVVYRMSDFNDSTYLQVYLNNKQGGFNYIGQSELPVSPVPASGANPMGWSSILYDFDGDGIPDLIIYPTGDPKTPAGQPNVWYFYKGLKPLQ